MLSNQLPLTTHVKMADTQTSQTSSMESSQTPQEDSFIPARRKTRKRKMKEDDSKEEREMDTSESAPKRPSFPPITSDKLMVISLTTFSLKMMLYNF